MKKLLVLCLVVLILAGMAASVTAEAAGSITLDFSQFTDQLEIATQLENPSYDIATPEIRRTNGIHSYEYKSS